MSHRRRVRRRLLCLLALAHSAAHAESPGEEAFRAAIGWTVEVRTSVSEPFVEDEQGSWIGAGLLVDPARGWILTNAHVAGHSYGKVAIAFKDGRAVPARRSLRRSLPRPGRARLRSAAPAAEHQRANARLRSDTAGRPPRRRVRPSVGVPLHRHARHHLRRYHAPRSQHAADRCADQRGQLRRTARSASRPGMSSASTRRRSSRSPSRD